MFVKSRMTIPVTYYKGSKAIVLKPMTVTYVNDGDVTADELRACYGQRIEIITGEMVEVTPETLEAGKKLEERTKDVDESFIDNILKDLDNEGNEEDTSDKGDIVDEYFGDEEDEGEEENTPVPTPEPTEAPTEEPTEAPTPEPTPKPVKTRAKSTKTKAKTGKRGSKKK